MHPHGTSRARRRAALILSAAPLLLFAGGCPAECDCEEEVRMRLMSADSVVIEPADDSVVIEPASAGGTARSLAVDSVVIEPRPSGGATLRIYRD